MMYIFGFIICVLVQLVLYIINYEKVREAFKSSGDKVGLSVMITIASMLWFIALPIILIYVILKVFNND